MREAMRGLAQGIVASHEARAAGLASLRKGIVASHEARAAGLASLRRDLSAQRREIRGLRKVESQHLQASLKRMASARKVESQHLQASLKRAASRRREHLARGLAELHEAGSHRRRIAQEQRRKLFREISGFLRQCAAARKVEARQLRETLSLVKPNLVHLADARARRRAVVEVWLTGLTSDRMAARHEWRQMIAALQKRRAGVTAPGAPAPTPPREKAVEEVGAGTPEVEAPKRGTRSRGGRRRRKLAGG